MRAARVLLAVAIPIAAIVVTPSPAAAASCAVDEGAGRSDFNGDGWPDVIVADPAASVNGVTGAGLVRVAYGAATGSNPASVATLAQGMAGVGNTPEPNDGFGQVLLVSDVDDDACADLMIGVPAEDSGAVGDVGAVHLVFGSPAGLGEGRSGVVVVQGSAGLPDVPESGDRFGAALALDQGWTEGNRMAIGMPGEDLGAVRDAGMVLVVDRSTAGLPVASSARVFSQSSSGVPGPAEVGDQFGSAVALVSHGRDMLLVGVPGEDLGMADVGVVDVLAGLAPGASFTAVELSQDSAGIHSTAEAGDRFGQSVAFQASLFSSITKVVVGAPYEDVGAVKDAGTLHILTDLEGDQIDEEMVHQDTPGIESVAEAGDRFGHRLLIIPWTVTHSSNHLAVGLPFEDVGTIKDAGAVHYIPIEFGLSKATDKIIHQNQPGIAGDAAPGEHFGASVAGLPWASGPGQLLIGVPDDTAYRSGAVAVLPYTDAADPPAFHPGVWIPGNGPFPAGGDRFGAVVGAHNRT
jgi:hypothetical protein